MYWLTYLALTPERLQVTQGGSRVSLLLCLSWQPLLGDWRVLLACSSQELVGLWSPQHPQPQPQL